MKKISLLMLIGVILILVACSKEKTVQDKEERSGVDPIESTYRDEDIFISISAEKEGYNHEETPVITISNDGKTTVEYEDSGTTLQYLRDGVWFPANPNEGVLDILNIIEPGKKEERKFSITHLSEKKYRVVFKFNEIGDASSRNGRVAVLFSVN